MSQLTTEITVQTCNTVAFEEEVRKYYARIEEDGIILRILRVDPSPPEGGDGTLTLWAAFPDKGWEQAEKELIEVADQLKVISRQYPATAQ